MPELNIRDTTKILRKGGCSSRIIAVTDVDDAVLARAYREAGMDSILVKPFRDEDLRLAVGQENTFSMSTDGAIDLMDESFLEDFSANDRSSLISLWKPEILQSLEKLKQLSLLCNFSLFKSYTF